MAYLIYNNDGSILTTLSNGEVDVLSTSLALVGKDVNNYGQYLNNNLVKLLTNFAGASEEALGQVQPGQLWFDIFTKKLKVYDGSTFQSSSGATIDGASPTPSEGELWFNSSTEQLQIWNTATSKWHLIGPAVSKTDGKFGIEPPIISIKDDITNLPKPVGVVYSYGDSVALISSEQFTMNTSSALAFLSTSVATTVVSGVTFKKDIDVKGDIYIRGAVKTPITSLSASYNITPFGNPITMIAIDNANIDIANDLTKLFPVETISTLSQVAYVVGSQARVLCVYNTATSVRRFNIIERGFGPEWLPMNLYYTAAVSTVTNIVS